jgi:putative spermidine/putrescine transport system substrate-binding protein
MPARMLLAAVAILAAGSATAVARDLTVAARGRSLPAAVTVAYLNPFADVTGVHAAAVTWEGGIDALRDQLKAPDNAWDLVLADPEELATGCSEGIFEKTDWTVVGGKDHYQSWAVTDCGVGAMLTNTVLAWDKDKFPVTPTWADFWDVAKYPGKRGLRKDVRGALEIALLADGVAPADIYKTLASKEGIERAFQKLDQLRPYIVWWQNGAEAAKILGSGDVLMTSAPSGAIATAARVDSRNFGLQFGSSLYDVLTWVIPKSSPNLRIAQQFLYFTGMPLIESRLVHSNGLVGPAKGLNEGLSPELQAISPSNPPNMASALRVDAAFWHDNLAKLRPRFDTWLSK